jgi:hypothetical protein
MGILERIADSHLMLLGTKPSTRPRIGEGRGALSFVTENPTTELAVNQVRIATAEIKTYSFLTSWVNDVPGSELIPAFMLTEIEPEALASLHEGHDLGRIAETASLLVMARSLGSIAQRLVLSEIEYID